MTIVFIPSNRRPAPKLTLGVVIRSDDRYLAVRGDSNLDDGLLFNNVILPNALIGTKVGDRVAMYRYPQDWVAVGIMR
jgi:hypothetical protein